MRLFRPFFLFFFSVALLLNACQKETPAPVDEPIDASSKQYINSPNQEDVLLGSISSVTEGGEVNFFGSTNAEGAPEKVKSITYKKSLSDTTFNFFLDENLKLKYFFFDINGTKDNFLYKLSYGNNDSVYFSVYHYNWTTNQDSLLYIAGIDKVDGQYNSTTLFQKSASWIPDFEIINTGFNVGMGVIAVVGGPISASALVYFVTKSAFTAAITAVVVFMNTSGAATLTNPPNSPPPSPSSTNTINPNSVTLCNNADISFATTMDQFGSIMFSNPLGGSNFQYSINNSAFQQSPVFNGPYSPGSYLVVAKTGEGCVRTEVRFIDNQINCSSLQLGVSRSGKVLSASASGGLNPYTFSFNSSTFSSIQNYDLTFDGNYEVVVKDANNCTDTVIGSVCDVQLTNVSIEPDGVGGYALQISYQSSLGLNPEFILGPNDIPLLIINSSNYSSFTVNSSNYCDGGGMSYPYLNPAFINVTGDNFNKTIKYALTGSSTSGTVNYSVSLRLPGSCFTAWSCPGNSDVKASQLYTLNWTGF